MLEVQNLNVFHGSLHVIWDVSFYVGDAEIVTLIGPNGAGKTTLVEAIAGVNRSVRGRVLFGGEEILGLRPYEIVRRGLALVPEKRELFPKMSVFANLRLGAYRNGSSEADCGFVYKLFPILEERKGQLAGTLSGGEQQMLAIARSLMSKPALLILDEPSLGLSPLYVSTVLDSIASLNRSGLSILLLEQNVKHALEISHRGYVIENGRITGGGSARDLLEDKAIQAAYMGV
jgi:branched-chain amino acid transport system ATP-binding protein